MLETLKTNPSSSTMESLLQYAVPAALYLTNNLIYFTVLPHATPVLLHVCMLMKLPATAILHHFLIKKQHNVHAWISLAVLCVGLVVFNVPSKSQTTSEQMHWYIAPIAGLSMHDIPYSTPLTLSLSFDIRGSSPKGKQTLTSCSHRNLVSSRKH